MKLAEFVRFSLLDIINTIGKDGAEKILSSFSSPKNPDTENYLKNEAVRDAMRGITQTHLVFSVKNNIKRFAGYFTIMSKTIFIESEKLSINTKKHIYNLAVYDNDRKCYKTPAILIAQLSKNFTDNADKIMSGDMLLEIAFEVINDIKMLTGIKVAYLECYNTQQLKSLYSRNGFILYDKRPTDEEEYVGSSNKMLQMLRIM